MAASSSPRDTLNIRLKPGDRDLIERGARLAGKTRTDFVLDATRLAAQKALLDQTRLVVSPEAYQEFLALLDAPPEPNEKLRRALQAPLPWK